MSMSSLRATLPRRLVVAAAALGVAAGATAHHSYAMFDASRLKTVSGSIAKLDFINPHSIVWLYVPSKDSPGKYELYAFETGSINTLTRLGWSATVLKTGDKVAIDYWPLKDGRNGGSFDKVRLADGRVLLGAGGPTVKGSVAPRPEFELPKDVGAGQ